MEKKKLTNEEKHEQLMKNIKIGFKQLILYFFISILIITTLIFIHYPPLYYTGTTISMIPYFIEQDRIEELYTFAFLILSWSLVLVPLLIFFKWKFVGKIFLSIYSFMIGLEKYIFYIQGENLPWNSAFNRETLETFLSEATIGGIKDAYTTYSTDYHFFLYLVIFPIGIFIFISVLLHFTKKVKTWISAISFPIFLLALSSFPLDLNAPYMYKVPLVIENYIIDSSLEKILKIDRHEIYFKDINKTKKTPTNIVFIMDESVRGDLISINNPNEKEVILTTPYLYSIKDKLINFGINYSMGNCSQISNMLFLSGFKKHLKIQPTIFQYMKNAGYETYLIDSPHNRLLDGFYHYDKKFIDNYISVRDNPKIERDKIGLEKLQKILKKPGKKFIYLLKQGAHFPFEENFKKEEAILEYDKKSERGFLNLYLNALKVAVDDYWKKLIKVIGNTDTVVFWQSDHGVNVVPDKGDKSIKLTHCETGLTHYKELYNVASTMYSPNKEYYKGFNNLKNGYSDVHMLPTILDMAGYNVKDIIKFYTTTYKNPDKNISIYTSINWGNNPMLPENIINLETAKKEAIEKGAFDEKVKISPLNKRRKL